MTEHPAERTDVLDILSGKWNIQRANIIQVVKGTLFRGDAAKATNEDVAVFLSVCAKYDLNPFLREIHVFIDKRGNVGFIVGVDGWINLRNRQERFMGVKFEDHLDKEGKLYATTCLIRVSGLDWPIEVTEYLSECMRDTEPWKKWPARMLRHKAHIQCIRSAFGFSGIVDEDEAERIQELDVTPALPAEPLSVAQAAATPPPAPPEPKAPAAEPPPIQDETPAAQGGPQHAVPPDPGVEGARQPLAGASGKQGELMPPSTPIPPPLRGHPRGGKS